MATFISILRGINVSGQKKILMANLKNLYENLGFGNVRTYIQSGNVVFDHGGKLAIQELVTQIEAGISKKYKFEVPVQVFSTAQMIDTLKNNPFLIEEGIDITKLHVTFLAATPSNENLGKLSIPDYSPDKYIINGHNIYLFCPNGYGRTKLSNTYIERKLKSPATTRNWKTINTLVEMSKRNE